MVAASILRAIAVHVAGSSRLLGEADYELCPVCFWEDDGQSDADADEVSNTQVNRAQNPAIFVKRDRGPNGSLSLTHARSNFADSRRMRSKLHPKGAFGVARGATGRTAAVVIARVTFPNWRTRCFCPLAEARQIVTAANSSSLAMKSPTQPGRRLFANRGPAPQLTPKG